MPNFLYWFWKFGFNYEVHLESKLWNNHGFTLIIPKPFARHNNWYSPERCNTSLSPSIHGWIIDEYSKLFSNNALSFREWIKKRVFWRIDEITVPLIRWTAPGDTFKMLNLLTRAYSIILTSTYVLSPAPLRFIHVVTTHENPPQSLQESCRGENGG